MMRVDGAWSANTTKRLANRTVALIGLALPKSKSLIQHDGLVNVTQLNQLQRRFRFNECKSQIVPLHTRGKALTTALVEASG